MSAYFLLLPCILRLTPFVGIHLENFDLSLQLLFFVLLHYGWQNDWPAI